MIDPKKIGILTVLSSSLKFNIELLTRDQKISFLQAHLLEWFNENRREFPWRNTNMTSFGYVISEILLQRTKAESVAKFYPEFNQRFPNWESIHSVKVEELEDILRPIGLQRQKSSRLKKLAEELVLLNGEFPEGRKELEKLTFLGQYIVNAILLFIHNKKTPLLDVNMARVLERVFGERKLADIRDDKYLQGLAYQFVKHEKSRDLNWAILDYAAMICKPKPSCEVCILISICRNKKKLA